MATDTVEIDSNKGWIVQLRADQMDCVIECLTYLIERHDARLHPSTDIGPTDRFANEQSRARIHELRAVFTAIGHRS